MSTRQRYQDEEDLQMTTREAAGPRRYDDWMGELLEGPYWIVDILPEQVDAHAAGQYFAVERYFRQPERILPLSRKYAEILLRLNCYADMTVSFDSCVSFTRVKRKAELPENWLTLTLGLPAPLDSPRVAAKCEPYPGRWTHHFVLSSQEELDGEMMAWIRASYDFADSKRRRMEPGEPPVRAGGSSTGS